MAISRRTTPRDDSGCAIRVGIVVNGEEDLAHAAASLALAPGGAGIRARERPGRAPGGGRLGRRVHRRRRLHRPVDGHPPARAGTVARHRAARGGRVRRRRQRPKRRVRDELVVEVRQPDQSVRRRGGRPAGAGLGGRRRQDRRVLRAERDRRPLPSARLAVDGDQPGAGRRVGEHIGQARPGRPGAVRAARRGGGRTQVGLGHAPGRSVRADGRRRPSRVPGAGPAAGGDRARRAYLRGIAHDPDRALERPAAGANGGRPGDRRAGGARDQRVGRAVARVSAVPGGRGERRRGDGPPATTVWPSSAGSLGSRCPTRAGS